MKIQNIEIDKGNVSGFKNAIWGMRYPLNSEKQSDSFLENAINVDTGEYSTKFILGKKDKELLLKLCKAGSDHRKVLRMINIQMSVKMPLYFWKQFDTYKVGIVANSRSTMHKITSRKLIKEDFAYIRWTKRYQKLLDSLNQLILDFNRNKKELNLKLDDLNQKELWYNIIGMLPSSYIQERMIQFNYEVALNIYFARKNHKLEEWHYFCNELLELPYFKEIVEYTEK